jgi:hypothetical protein
MIHDTALRQMFNLCKEKNKFVFEVVDIFGDHLSSEEMEYWFVHGVITSASIYDIDLEGRTFEEVLESISEADRKRRMKWKNQKSQLKKISSPKG